MKYGAHASNPLESLAFLLGKVPIPALDALMPLLKARSIHAGVELGVFDALRDGPLAAGELASRCRLDREATEMLLRCLVACQYLEQRGDAYSLSAVARRHLLRGAEKELWAFTLWSGKLWDTLGRLDEMLATGRGFDLHDSIASPEYQALYQRAMLEVARLHAAKLAGEIELPPGARRMLDVAGSHGLFAAELVRRNPGLSAEVLDLPNAIGAARALAREEGIGDLVSHRAGDLLTADLGEGELDLVFLANILHHFRPEQNLELLRRIHRALVPGGQVAIWDIEPAAAGSKAGIGDLAGLFFRLTSGARTYRPEEYRLWLREAGFAETGARRILSLPGYALMLGRK
jgi:SAM-dependent methyltransferase